MAVFLKSIREFFWPRLEGDVPEPDKITEEQCKFPDEQIEFLMEIITCELCLRGTLICNDLLSSEK